MKFDVAVFGSATHDTYLSSEEFKPKETNEGVMFCQTYGGKVEIEESVVTTGGGATNTCVCFERLGLQTAIIACVGNDFWGRMLREQLESEGVSLLYLQKSKKLATSSSVVLVNKSGDRTLLVHRAASNLLSETEVDWDRLGADYIYVSSLGGNLNFLKKIIDFSKEKDCRIAFNPGSSELDDPEQLKQLIDHIHILIVNKQEALRLSGGDEINPEWFFNCGAEMTLITNGKKGASLFTKHKKIITQDAIKVKAVEVTGAGDSFGSSFVAGQILNLSIEKSLKMAALNSSSVVQHIGPKAGLLFWPEIKQKINS